MVLARPDAHRRMHTFALSNAETNRSPCSHRTGIAMVHDGLLGFRTCEPADECPLFLLVGCLFEHSPKRHAGDFRTLFQTLHVDLSALRTVVYHRHARLARSSVHDQTAEYRGRIAICLQMQQPGCSITASVIQLRFLQLRASSSMYRTRLSAPDCSAYCSF